MPERDDIPKIVGVAIAKSPKLVLKISWRYLKAKKQAQRAETIFRKRLEASGMDPRTAAELADRYASTVSLRHIMKQLGIPGIAFNGDNGTE
jgi:hypothetical protein